MTLIVRLLTFFALFLSVSVGGPTRRETNAQRFARGLGPAPPKTRYAPGGKQVRTTTTSGSLASTDPIPAVCSSWYPFIDNQRGGFYEMTPSFIIRAENVYHNVTRGYFPTPEANIVHTVVDRAEAGCFKFARYNGLWGDLGLFVRGADGSAHAVFLSRAPFGWYYPREDFSYWYVGLSQYDDAAIGRMDGWSHTFPDFHIGISITDGTGTRHEVFHYVGQNRLILSAYTYNADAKVLLYPEPFFYI